MKQSATRILEMKVVEKYHERERARVKTAEGGRKKREEGAV